MTEVVVSGGRGRLGASIVAAIDAEKDLSAFVLGRADLPDEQIIEGRVLVATAPHDVTVKHCEIAKANKVPLLIATTGFSSAEMKAVEAASEMVAVVIAPNLSPGVTVLLDLVEKASRALPDYDLELFEIHHNKKKDSPSGTALAIANAAARARGRDADRDMIMARAGDVGERGQHEIGVQTLRGGGVIGEHTLMIVGQTERLELIHRASSRDVFAAGAVQAIRFVFKAKAGLYSMRDVLGLSA
jgi:4-hydroxy-tetrahydrodipicolinate reductase